MILRQLGFGVQELEAGPLVFLISRSVPVAYRDTRPEAPAPGVYRTDRWLGKATTRHCNLWLRGKTYSTVPHDLILTAFRGVSRYTEVGV